MIKISGQVCLGLLFASMLMAKAQADREITIFHTNDIESVYEPVEAYWRDDLTHIGGVANLSTLIRRERASRPRSLLLDAGDIFTGSLSKATGGKLAFDLYSAMGYDALNLGNHEFEYGWQVLRQVMQRSAAPVLCANIFYEGTDIPFAQQYTILESDGVRVGVIGVMGIDAFINTMMKSNRAGLEVRAPIEVVQPIVDELLAEVDLVIVLTHQNQTAPMQTNKEADPSVQRGFDEDYELAGRLRGVDMIIGGHSDNGLLQPVVHPDTGTAIGLTFGQGMHLGYATFRIPDEGKPALKPALVEGGLIAVDADALADDEKILKLLAEARLKHLHLAEVIGHLDRQAVRLYYRESDIGNLLADLLRQYSGTDIGLVPAGAIRADLLPGEVTVEEVLNVFPFTDTVTVVDISGEDLLALLEKSLALEYGLTQLSGVTLVYDDRKPVGERLISAQVAGKDVVASARYTISTGSFTATGGENYTMLAKNMRTSSETLVSTVFVEAFRHAGDVQVPDPGRQQNVNPLAAQVKQ